MLYVPFYMCFQPMKVVFIHRTDIENHISFQTFKFGQILYTLHTPRVLILVKLNMNYQAF